MQHWGEREAADPKLSAWDWLARVINAVVMVSYVATLFAPLVRALR
jgi:hypothetical protein